MRRIILFGCCWVGIGIGLVEVLYRYLPDRMDIAVLVLVVVLGGLLAWKLVFDRFYVYVALVKEKGSNRPHIIVFDDREAALEFGTFVDEESDDEVVVAMVPLATKWGRDIK